MNKEIERPICKYRHIHLEKYNTPKYKYHKQNTYSGTANQTHSMRKKREIKYYFNGKFENQTDVIVIKI